MTSKSKYTKTLAQLESEVRVARADQVEEQATDPPHDFIPPEEADRLRLLGITGAGRLRHR